MLKLYREEDGLKEYWEAWQVSAADHTIHWGVLGTRGASKVADALTVRAEIDDRISRGFVPIQPEDHAVLLIEYPIEGVGTEDDLSKRHRLEDRMNETLGWIGLGACDGGSTGSGTMEVCNFVVDFEIAKG